MKKDEKNMKDFLSAVKMGEETFKIYRNEVTNPKLVDLIDEALSTFSNHESKIENVIESYGYQSNCSLKKSQEFALMMENINIRKKDDFQLCLEMIDAMRMGMIKGLEFIHKNATELDKDFMNACKEVIRDYDNVQTKFKEYAINLI